MGGVQFLQAQQHHFHAFGLELVGQFVAQAGVLLYRAAGGLRLIGSGDPGLGLRINERRAVAEAQLQQRRQAADETLAGLADSSGHFFHRQARGDLGSQVTAAQPVRRGAHAFFEAQQQTRVSGVVVQRVLVAIHDIHGYGGQFSATVAGDGRRSA
ncbi:hypothetical protein D3C84_927610 [compost metagenome]